MANDRRRVCVLSNGCPENRLDAARSREFFAANDHPIVTDYRRADLIFFNACGLTEDSETLSLRVIRHIQNHKRRDAELVVYGCLGRIHPERLRPLYGGDAFGSDELDRLEAYTQVRRPVAGIRTHTMIPFLELPAMEKLRVHRRGILSWPTLKEILCGYPDTYNDDTFCIKISSGCIHHCTYCAVKNARGDVRSRPLVEIAAGFDTARSRGQADIALIGTDLGSYGRDNGGGLIQLLHTLLERDGPYRIKLRNLHPRYLIHHLDSFLELLRRDRIVFIGTSVQSGSNRILHRMGRGYTVESFLDAVGRITASFPSVRLGTQVMAGFPGESREDFQATLAALDGLKLDVVEPFLYQRRPHTRAATFPDQVPESVARRRFRSLVFRCITREKTTRNTRRSRSDG